ncbi:hypothetical protein L226DRAFT_357035 [Lentinus tigrinus ALCF2SS1-7]|uniref:uncharacterized protein n=1 Tax=Lentinus tigrinus ALCF2SS1-7 TaxID=1328758 RepID=UPI00116603E4|nr:hypothetical protein L226DRAFT_357035 [Lentinus tigrinus ALCF2SS1-7]
MARSTSGTAMCSCRAHLETDHSYRHSVLLLCHLANILVCMLAEPAYKDSSVTITTVAATMLISRLMLNIRDPDLRTRHLHLTSDNSAV